MKHTKVTMSGPEIAAIYEGLNLLYKKRLKQRFGLGPDGFVSLNDIEALKQRLFEAYRVTEAEDD